MLPATYPLSDILTDAELHRPLVEVDGRGYIPPVCPFPGCGAVMRVHQTPFVTNLGPSWDCARHGNVDMVFEVYQTNIMALVRARAA